MVLLVVAALERRRSERPSFAHCPPGDPVERGCEERSLAGGWLAIAEAIAGLNGGLSSHRVDTGMCYQTRSVYLLVRSRRFVCVLCSPLPPGVQPLPAPPQRHSAAASMPSTLRAARGRHKYQGGECTVHVHLNLQLLRTEGFF